jgi:hypothetical protein
MEEREQIPTRNYIKELIIVSFITSVVGLILVLNSVHFGTSVAESWLMKRGGADTGLYHIVIKGNIQKFLVAGSVLFTIGLLTSIVGFYISAVLKINNK